MHFTDFEIDNRLLSVLKSDRIETPTPIQEKAIPVALTGKDLVGIAQTGTGKTLAFSLPSLTRLAEGKITRNMMLVLAPTRELAQQVETVMSELGKPLGIRTVAIYGGVDIKPQIAALKKGCSVIVATPGRLLDHVWRKNIRFDQLMILALDEADRMLDMGFLPDVHDIVSRLPKERQTLMFSATLPDEIVRLTSDMMNEPERVTIGAIAKPVDKVRQRLYPVYTEDKLKLLVKILGDEDIDSALLFCRTKHRTDRLARQLREAGHKATPIHGDRSQRQRQQALDGFKSGRYKILVATDVAARGLDVDGISHVVNYDIPLTSDDYIHRIGRTARANTEGDAITFVSPEEHEPLANIEKTLGKRLDREEWDRAAPVLSTWRPPGEKVAKPKRRMFGGGRGKRGRMLRR
jgi:ATP-dependent RNA helicase RhlE